MANIHKCLNINTKKKTKKKDERFESSCAFAEKKSKKKSSLVPMRWTLADWRTFKPPEHPWDPFCSLIWSCWREWICLLTNLFEFQAIPCWKRGSSWVCGGGVRVWWGVFMQFSLFSCGSAWENFQCWESMSPHTKTHTCTNVCTRLEGTNKPLEGPILEKYNKAIVTLCGGHT